MTSRGASGGSDEEEVDDDEIDDDRSATPTLVLRALTPERSSSDRAVESSRASSERGLRVIFASKRMDRECLGKRSKAEKNADAKKKGGAFLFFQCSLQSEQRGKDNKIQFFFFRFWLFFFSTTFFSYSGPRSPRKGRRA